MNGQNCKQNWQHWAIPGKLQREWLRVYFSENPHGIFRFVTLLQEIPEKSWDFCRIAWHPLQINKVKNQDPWKVHDFFLYTPGSSTSFLIDPWSFHMLFRQYLWEFHVLNLRPCLNFSWNSPFRGVLAKNLPKSKSNLRWQFLLLWKHLKI